MRTTAIAAPNPESMFTTVTPDEQPVSMPMSAVKPERADPYPTDVGTATTGRLTSPPTTDGKAPSIPAMQITAQAELSQGKTASKRCSPATPTSHRTSDRTPAISKVSSASLAM